MNVFNKVTLEMLKKNKSRTVVTIIGIILSAAMICAVTTSVASLYNYLLQNEIYESGDWHGAATDTDWQTFKRIEKSAEVENAVYFHQLGYAVAEGCKNEYKPYLFVIGASDGFKETMPVHITKGRYPASPSEILIPHHLHSNGGVETEIGDVLTLEVGERIFEDYSMGQNNPYQGEAESLENTKTRTYEIVGFYERPGFEEYTAPGYTAITVAEKNIDIFGKYDVFFKMNKPSQIYSFMETNKISGTTNSDVLLYSGVSAFDGFTATIYSLAAIVIALIMFGSVSLIYNAFSISVSERTKQFGLLSSIGATKKQLRKMVLFEALAVSTVGIPLGVIAGVGGIGVTLMVIGHRLQQITDFAIPMRVCVSPVAIVAAIVIALLTVLISAWIPSKRATRVSAIEAIRQTKDVNVKEKNVKLSPITYKLFGLPGVLASKYYKRSRKKYRTTVVSLFMSVVLFVSASAFTDYLMATVEAGFDENAIDISYITEHSKFDNEGKGGITRDELLEKFKKTECVTDAVYTQHTVTNATIDKKYLKEKVAENAQSELINRSGKDEAVADIAIGVVFVNDSEFEKLVAKYKLDKSKYFDKENPLSIVVDGNTTFNSEKEKYVRCDVLKSDESVAEFTTQKDIEGYYHYGNQTDEEGNEFIIYASKTGSDRKIIPVEETKIHLTLESGKRIYEKPFYCNMTSANLIYIYPASMMESFNWNKSVRSYFFSVISTDHAKSSSALKTMLLDNGFSTTNLFDHGQEVENERNLVMIVRIFAYGFIVLISLISAANVFNTISTNIALRRREFAMLKSVGMTKKGFNRMMNFECLLYGSRALLFGIPVSVGVTFAIWYTINQGFYELDFALPWTAMGIAVFSVFAVVFATIIFAMNKIKKENPIDALKNENI
ncbi:MAG: ABC transporter permease [Clostridia bacterium]|nr:ABC transporter permease [Clostridia bacterium]